MKRYERRIVEYDTVQNSSRQHCKQIETKFCEFAGFLPQNSSSNNSSNPVYSFCHWNTTMLQPCCSCFSSILRREDIHGRWVLSSVVEIKTVSTGFRTIYFPRSDARTARCETIEKECTMPSVYSVQQFTVRNHLPTWASICHTSHRLISHNSTRQCRSWILAKKLMQHCGNSPTTLYVTVRWDDASWPVSNPSCFTGSHRCTNNAIYQRL